MTFEYTRCTTFQGADCDADRCLVVVKCKGNLAVGTQAAKRFGVDRFILRKLNELEVR
jgi:hypothetical protein